MAKDIVVAFRHPDATGLFRGENGSNFGGMETRAYLLATTLAKIPGFRVAFITDEDVSGLASPGIRFLREPSPIKRGIPFLSRYLNRRRFSAPMRAVEPDVLLTFLAGPIQLKLALDLASSVDCVTLATLSCDADIDGSLVGEVDRPTYFQLLRQVDGVIAQTSVQQQLLAETLGIPATVLPSLVNVSEAMEPQRGRTVLWVGRAAPIKRPWLFIALAAALPQHKFVMVLLPHDQLLWEPLVADAVGLDNLTIIPGVPYFEMDGYYRDAALLVGTSFVEGFPNVYLQAASHGVPTVSLGIPTSTYEYSGGCGVNVGTYFSALVGEVDRLMVDNQVRRSLGNAAYDYVKSTHATEVVGQALAEIITTAVGSAARER